MILFRYARQYVSLSVESIFGGPTGLAQQTGGALYSLLARDVYEHDDAGLYLVHLRVTLIEAKYTPEEWAGIEEKGEVVMRSSECM